jgi:DNA-directed RNA polymerase I, II, and III subunit RPABC2
MSTNKTKPSSSYFEDDEDEPTFNDEDNSETEDESEKEEEEELVVDDLEGDELEGELDDGDLEDDEELEEEDELEDEQEGGAETENENENDLEEEDLEDDLVDTKKRTKKIPKKTVLKKPFTDDSEAEKDEDEDDDDGEMHLQKFDRSLNENYLLNAHPECTLQNYDEILSMIKVVRDKDDIIIDDLHKTIPYLTKYERARILGQRARQIDSGSTPFIKVPENVIDGYIIAELELKEKRIPFIIRRPLPNGGSEYWSIKDLEDISF